MYRVKDFTFNIYNHDHIDMPANMSLFLEDGNGDYDYDIYICDDINIKDENFIFNNDIIKITKTNNLETRYLYIRNAIRPYAMSKEVDDKHTVIYVDKAYTSLMYLDTMFVSLLSLEKRMFEKNHFILHSAYMTHKNKAILFSAPSGTGKSTQADLWVKYRNSRVVNGDKSLLSKDDNGYYANGWPICGSSEICFNERYPIACIVVLSQGKVNTVKRLGYKDAFKKVLSELTINYHNSQYVNDAMNFIDDLLLYVPIYHLTCDISENAVKCLENQLIKDGIL